MGLENSIPPAGMERGSTERKEREPLANCKVLVIWGVSRRTTLGPRWPRGPGRRTAVGQACPRALLQTLFRGLGPETAGLRPLPEGQTQLG